MKITHADIITIGDEILYGQITDTNSQWISAELDHIGIKIARKTSVGDNETDILQLITEAESRSDLILITGGLGPTSDDLTKPCLAKYFNSHLIINEEVLNDLKGFFEKRGRELTETNKQQAYVPNSCKVIRNNYGTAPGMWFERNGKVFISMPGVPFEMKAMMTDTILPRLKEFFSTPFIYHRVVKTIGIGESFIADKIKDWEKNLPTSIKLAYLPSLGEVKLRLTALGDESEVKPLVEAEAVKLNELIFEYVYTNQDESIEKVIGNLLKENNLTIAFAESCTGGYLSSLITSVPGSSAYFAGSVVAYQNEIKEKLLGVKPETLKEFGAVSEQTVKEMAEGVRLNLNAAIGVSTSGIAGPGGGTGEKPIGTIWIAYSDKQKTIARKLTLGKLRDVNIKQTATAALNLIRQSLQ